MWAVVSYIHNWSLLSFRQDYDLPSHITYVVYVNFIREWRNVDSEQPILEKLFIAILLTLGVFTRRLLRRNRRRNICSYFRFDAWPWVWSRALHLILLLDYDNILYVIITWAQEFLHDIVQLILIAKFVGSFLAYALLIMITGSMQDSIQYDCEERTSVIRLYKYENWKPGKMCGTSHMDYCKQLPEITPTIRSKF